VSSHLIDEDIKWTLEYSGNRSPVCNIYHPHSGELFASRPAIFLLNTSVESAEGEMSRAAERPHTWKQERWKRKDGRREMEQVRWNKRDGTGETEHERWNRRYRACETEQEGWNKRYRTGEM
jgi:hypothetical protein